MEFGEARVASSESLRRSFLCPNFSKFYYAKITPSGRDIAAMRVNIDSVKAHVIDSLRQNLR